MRNWNRELNGSRIGGYIIKLLRSGELTRNNPEQYSRLGVVAAIIKNATHTLDMVRVRPWCRAFNVVEMGEFAHSMETLVRAAGTERTASATALERHPTALSAQG